MENGTHDRSTDERSSAWLTILGHIYQNKICYAIRSLAAHQLSGEKSDNHVKHYDGNTDSVW